MRERDLLNKDVVAAEEQGKKKTDEKLTEDNEIKKLNNKHTGFKTQAEKLHQQIMQLEQDKNKYGIDASHANAKYYQCLERVKHKQNLITKLQKKNIEAEAKLKQQ